MPNLSLLNIVSADACCGCGACANVCPRMCITMRLNEQGFLHPYLNEAECTHCNLCQKVCPIRNDGKWQKTEEAYISCKNRDDKVRLKSASGGLFYLLGQLMLQGGVSPTERRLMTIIGK